MSTSGNIDSEGRMSAKTAVIVDHDWRTPDEALAGFPPADGALDLRYGMITPVRAVLTWAALWGAVLGQVAASMNEFSLLPTVSKAGT